MMAMGNNVANKAQSFADLNNNMEAKRLKERADLREHCEEFVSILVYQLVSTMRKTVPKTGLIDGGNAEQIFQSMLDQEHSMTITKASNFDLVEQLYEQMSYGLDDRVTELPPPGGTE